jgi:hypothetical protein
MLLLGLALSLWVASGVAVFLLMVVLCVARRGSVAVRHADRSPPRGRRMRLRRRLPAQRSELPS